MPKQLFIGITGHRDPRPQAVAGLRLAMENLYRQLARDGVVDLTMINGLAEGADRLAAQVFIETRRKMGAANWRLHGVLPFDESEYIKDFPNLIDEYYALKNQCDEIITLPS
ncbi:MAG: hypothetical protein QM523_02470, partial [Candidatus Pacebacteria bacterium]|nr:hypothetical protein [Candidatus Paceibacterota bacterium]